MSNILEGLNRAQYDAVVNYESPSLIIAGAGSGKTRVLTARIAYMLEQGVAPHSIIALTFTNKAASQMRERLTQMVDPVKARYITMGTFHSIFSRIIRENAELLGYPTTYSIFQPSDAKSLIKSILKELDLSEDRYKPNVVLSRISYAKNQLITAGAYRANDSYLAEDRENRMPQFADVYAAYCARCKASGALDFDDLLLQTNILFRDHPEVLAKYQQRYQYILVDEYQDTNFAQYIIIRRLSQTHGRVCVVGDDAQSIYSFRGAKIENILNFEKHYPTAKRFKLEQNYRSTQNIVDAANSLIAHNKTKLDKRCFSEGDRGEKICINRALNDREEAQSVADMICSRHRDDDASWGEIAVLYRNNAQSQAMEQALRVRGVPYKIHKGNSFYEHKEIKDMMAYIRVVINPRDDEAFRRIVNYPARGIGGTTVERIALLAKERGRSMWEAVDLLVEEPVSDAVQRTIVRKVKEFVELIREISAQRAELSLYDFGMLVASRSGILPSLRMADKIEAAGAIENIEELLNTMQLFSDQVEAEVVSGERLEGERATVEEWLQSVLLLTDQESGEEEEEDRVTLMTVHSSKGLEYEYVYIIGVEQNLFPSQRALESGEVEEERRLFYVAITRAKIAAALSYCDMRYKWGNMEFSRPSMLLSEIDSQYVELGDDVELGGARARAQQPETRTTRVERATPRYEQRRTPSTNTMPRPAVAPRPTRDTSGMRSLGSRRVETEATPATPSENYAIGDRISHESFGRGRVTSVVRVTERDILTVDFESVGEKKIIANLAPIKKI